MEIQQLKGFIAVAKYGGFSQAAEKTFRTQPAISLQVKSLEKEFNVKLFNRLGAKNVTLTEDGKTLLSLLSPIIDDISTLPTRFKEISGKPQKGSIKIATHTSVMAHLLPDPIRKFKKKYPECELSIVNRDRLGILSMLNNDEIDCGITSLSSVPDNIEYKVFATFQRFLIGSKSHPLSKKSAINLEDIIKFPLVLPPIGSNTRDIIDRALKQKNLKPKVSVEITGKTAVKTYIQMGDELAIINGFYLSQEDKKNLFCKDMEKYFGKADRGVLTRKNKYLSFHSKAFIKMLLT